MAREERGEGGREGGGGGAYVVLGGGAVATLQLDDDLEADEGVFLRVLVQQLDRHLHDGLHSAMEETIDVCNGWAGKRGQSKGWAGKRGQSKV